MAAQIAQTEREFGIDTSVEDYQKELKFGLVEVVYEWAREMVRICRTGMYADVLNLVCSLSMLVQPMWRKVWVGFWKLNMTHCWVWYNHDHQSLCVTGIC